MDISVSEAYYNFSMANDEKRANLISDFDEKIRKKSLQGFGRLSVSGNPVKVNILKLHYYERGFSCIYKETFSNIRRKTRAHLIICWEFPQNFECDICNSIYRFSKLSHKFSCLKNHKTSNLCKYCDKKLQACPFCNQT